MSLRSVKLLLVEDSVVLSDRLAEVIANIAEIDLVATVDTESKALAELKRQRIDIVLLDLQLKEGSGMGVLREAALLHRKPVVIVLTNHDVEAYDNLVGELGATQFLDKARDFGRLEAVLMQVVAAVNK